MAFMDLFRPKWKHSDSMVRIPAVAKLTNQALLTEIANSDSDSRVRMSAASKLTDQAAAQEVYAEIAKADKDHSVRLAAAEKLTDQALAQSVFADIAWTNSDEGVRLAGVEKLTDQDLLAEIAKTDSDARVRLAAVERITGANVLAEVASSDSDGDVCKAAAQRLPDTDVRKAAIETRIAKATTMSFYSQAVRCYGEGDYRQALDGFNQCLQDDDYSKLAVFARALCQKKLGLNAEMPDEYRSSEGELGQLFNATNFACHLIDMGHQAALRDSSCVLANIDGSRYDIRFVSFLGSVMINAWRREGGRTVPLTDPSANPRPSNSDRLITSLIQQISTLPLAPLPKKGIPNSLH